MISSMKQHRHRSFRIAGCSLVAIALTACARMMAPQEALLRSEPRHSPPPPEANRKALASLAEKPAQPDAMRRRLAELDRELVHLKDALKRMSPLPAQREYLVPVEMSAIDHSPDGRVSTIDVSMLYASPPSIEDARSLFYVAELGSYRSRREAESAWATLSSNAHISGLSASFLDDPSGVRLLAGPFTTEDAAAALCVEISALVGSCRENAWQGAYN